MLAFSAGCAHPQRESFRGPLQPMPDLPLQIVVQADELTGDFGSSAALALAERLARELAASGPVPLADSSALVLRVRLLEAWPGEATARILVGWDLGRPLYRLEAGLWWQDRLLDQLRIRDPLLPGDSLEAEPLEILVEDAAFRLRRFLDIRRPCVRQKTTGI